MSPHFSALYAGRVRHTRVTPRHHDFTYRVYYLLIDVDELDALDRDLTLFSVGRFNLLSFRPADHGPADGTPLRPWVERTLAEAGIDLSGGRVELLAFPRVLGYAFNPLSVWYCYGPSGDLRAVIHEVRNTFGDRHAYVVPVPPGSRRHSFSKEMHVSPFNGMDQEYRFTITEPGRRLTVAIELTEVGQTVLRAGFSLSRLPLTDRNLLRLFVTHPLLTAKVIAGIHWQALRLWRKGAKYHRVPEPSSRNMTIFATSEVTR